MKDLFPPQRKPEPAHYELAKKEYEEKNEGKFEDLPTRKRNALAKDQMFHQEYHDLCRAIMRT